MSYNNGKTTSELFAVVDKDENVVYTRGGSSSPMRLMVYESRRKAERALSNKWIKQAHNSGDVNVIQVYSGSAKS